MAAPKRTIDDILSQARAGLRRLSPEETAAAVQRGALLVDIRPAAQRGLEGEIPGALVIERNQLEWRLDPQSDSRIPAAIDHDIEVVVFCSEGYTSSLAASSLQELGLHRATDIDGGFHAWRRAGLPVTAGELEWPEPAGRPDGAGRRDDPVLTLDPGRALDIEGVRQVVDGRPVDLSSAARERVRAAREIIDETVASGAAVYGLTAGLGHARDQRLSAASLAGYQVGIILSHAGGVGPPLPTAAVRAAMLARLNSATRGGGALTERSVEMLVRFLNAGVHPVVPEIGSVGASDLMHLAAVALVAIGLGEAEYRGNVLTGGDALAAAGLGALQLEAGEGLALVSANSFSIGMGCLVAARARQLVEEADVVAALSLEAVEGNLSVIEPAVGVAKPVPGQIATIRHLRSLLAGSPLFEPGRASSLQDALSFRVIPQVHGAARELVDALKSAVELELNAMDDNPLVWIPERRLISNGNFHPMAMALYFDALRPALAHLGLCSIRRMNHLGNAVFGEPEGFEEMMTVNAEQYGRVASLYAGAALWAELRQLAGPATLDIESLDFEQEDHATASFLTVATTERTLGLLERILAIELGYASFVFDRRSGEEGLGAGTGAALERVRSAVAGAGSAARCNDALTELLRTGELLRTVGPASTR